MTSPTILGSKLLKTKQNEEKDGRNNHTQTHTPSLASSLASSCLTVIESSADRRAPYNFLPVPTGKSLEDCVALSRQECACCCQGYNTIQNRNECKHCRLCRHLHLRLASATTLWVRTVTIAAASAPNATTPAWEHTSALTVETLNRLTVTQHGRTGPPP